VLAQRKLQAVLTWVGLLVVASLVSGCCLSGPSIEVTPSEVEMEVDDIVSISARWHCLKGGVTWTATCGSIGPCPYRYSFVIGSRIGYTAPEEPGSCTVTATGTARPDVSASTLVTVTAPSGPAAVRITPRTAALVVNEALEFTAVVTGALDRSVTWDASCGSISGSGNTITYTAPATEGPCEVTATSHADPSSSATASVTVTVGSDFEPAPSYITIENVSLAGASGGARRVSFDISWPESWRGPDRPTWVQASDNWDAAWVFVKYRVDRGTWQHATLAGSGHVAPSGAVVSVPSDRVGAFIHRSGSGYGTFTAHSVGLQWDFVADGVAVDASVEVVPLGIEMVYVPQGSFSLGSGGSGTGEFRAGGTTNSPFVVDRQASIALGNAAAQLMWTTTGDSGAPSGSTNASFPTGFGAFYAMKYQVTQGQYVDFLNTLTQAQADVRKYTWSTNRYAITGSSVGSYASTLPFVAMHYVSWADGAAFADWAGLRPMTELEFEKVARGPLAPVTHEFAWGSTSITPATGLANAGTIAEAPTPAAANANYGDGIGGPVRVGSFPAPGRSRRDAGAGYYGALELSGNLWERPVTVGNAAGRAFAGTHGDGSLDAGANADVASWPNSSAVGAGFRGGNWRDDAVDLQVSSRLSAATVWTGRLSNRGWRGARSVP
jgi:formylglycine-generating enzyme required for sulfatase activity